jgi:hypothetical protein
MLEVYDNTEAFADAVQAVEGLLARTPYSGQARRKQWLDKLGWPVVFFKGRPITNAIRFLLHARKRGVFFDYAGDPSSPTMCCDTGARRSPAPTTATEER